MKITKELLILNSIIKEYWCWEYKFNAMQKWLNTYWRIQYRDELGKKRSVQAHRVSFEMYNDVKIPKWMLVCHKCDNPKCINPKHLFLWTPKDNTLDMIKKGRWKHDGLNKWGIFNAKKVCINWTIYVSLEDAGRALWISWNAVKKRIKSEKYWYKYLT